MQRAIPLFRMRFVLLHKRSFAQLTQLVMRDGVRQGDQHGPHKSSFNTQYTNLVYNGTMHVIAKPALVEFWERFPDAESSLKAWYHTMESEIFINFNDLRETFASADYVDGLTVFNIGGNKYRLIAAIHYNRYKVFIRAVLTHGEYDYGHWKKRK
ncbi:MAG: type II toxin-antitoxin system HigB family toxin [Nitrosospira sp.]|nr:type II toxin-antitoxin system HigB family toxin [Nitrosospira sp.]MDN5936135.1 type II toxin-antitoxin system HigB family toxin [Nitrosospira sp.]